MLTRLRAELDGPFARRLLLWQKTKADLVQEMDTVVQMPGWGNIWTQPIINRIDMLATGVRTMIGVKVFGNDLDKIQAVSEEVAAVLRQVPGAVDVYPDQNIGKGYLEIVIDRQKAARYGVNVGDIQDVIEVALGGKAITMTVEGRERFPVRIRYARHWREDEEQVKNLLVNAGGGMRGGGMDNAGAAAAARRRPRSRPRRHARANPAFHGGRRADRRRPGHDQERERHVALLRATERPRPRHRGLRRGGPARRGAEGEASAGHVPGVERPVRAPGPRQEDPAGRLSRGAWC